MQPPARGTALYDVDNVEAFVRAVVSNTKLRLTDDERDELIAEGVLILLGLADRYEHHRPGYRRPGSFAGYAASILPGRITDAWRRLTDQRYVTGPDGDRRWEPGPGRVSLEVVREQDGGEPVARAHDEPGEVEPFDVRLRNALREGIEAKIALCSQIAIMRADGMSEREVAGELGIALAEVRDAERWLADAVGRLE